MLSTFICSSIIIDMSYDDGVVPRSVMQGRGSNETSQLIEDILFVMMSLDVDPIDIFEFRLGASAPSAKHTSTGHKGYGQLYRRILIETTQS